MASMIIMKQVKLYKNPLEPKNPTSKISESLRKKKHMF